MKGLISFIKEFLYAFLLLIAIVVIGILTSIFIVGSFLIALIFKKRSEQFVEVLDRLDEFYASLLDR